MNNVIPELDTSVKANRMLFPGSCYEQVLSIWTGFLLVIGVSVWKIVTIYLQSK